MREKQLNQDQQDMQTSYSLTQAQKQIWYTEMLYPGSASGILSCLLTIRGQVIEELLEEALHKLVFRHDSLRMRLIRSADEPEPIIHVGPCAQFHISRLDAHSSDLGNWKEIVEHRSRTPFPLYDAELFDFMLIRTGEEEIRVHLKVHHLVVDGFALNTMGNEFVQIYAQLLAGETVSDEVRSSYADLVNFETSYESSPRFEKDQQFWAEEYTTMPTVARMGQEDVAFGESASNSIVFPLALEDREALSSFCKSQEISVFTLFVAGLYVYLNKVSGEEDIQIGTIFANRTSREQKAMVGLLMSMTPYRMKIDSSLSFLEFLKQVKLKQSKLIRHQKYPFSLIGPKLRETFGYSGSFMELILSYRPMDWNGGMIGSLEFEVDWNRNGFQENELTIHIEEHVGTGELAVRLDYLENRFTASEMEQLHNRLMTLLRAAVADSVQPINNLPVLSADEEHLFLTNGEGPVLDYPRHKSIHQLFEEQAEKAPDHVAVVFKEQQLTYLELNERANQLARVLQSKGVGLDQRVGIMMERSLEMVVAMLGILKAGGAYVPLDPDYPQERVAYILEDSGTKLLLTQAQYVSSEAYEGEVLLMEELAGKDGNASNLDSAHTPNQLAYVIYTSGSTGKPKGVMIEHQQVSHFFTAMNEKQLLQDDDVFLAVTTVSFDISVLELLWTLTRGVRVVILPGDVNSG